MILQARMSSKRLPAKVILPLAGIPMSVLCAKRCVIKNVDFVLATSTDATDDILVSLFKNNNIEIYRGNLDNVLERFINIIDNKSLNNDDVVIRLTADNPVVDKYFLKEMMEIYESNKLDYLSAEPINLDQVNWPKGLSAEFIKVGLLKDSYINDTSDMNIEHVTFSIRNNIKKIDSVYDYLQLKNDHTGLILSVDNFKDYIRAERLFSNSSWNINYQTYLENSLK